MFTMDKLQIFTKDDIRSEINFRLGETRLGEEVQAVMRLEDLHKFRSTFVIVGVPEDYGVLANDGIGGAHTAWKSFLKAFLNLQQNSFLNGSDFILLGQLVLDPPRSLKIEHIRDKVALIDNLLYPVIQQIMSAGKIPIVIGGGHNNAYGLIKGASLATNRKVNVINIDAHADLRDLEGRHSGNGFSYAKEDGYLANYGIFGLQQNYITHHIQKALEYDSTIFPVYYEDILISNYSITQQFQSLCEKTQTLDGLEIDLDCVENLVSSASSPSGFRLDQVRELVLRFGSKFNYLHICEGAAELADGRINPLIGKTIAFLVSDLAKSKHNSL
ncbi:MAG: arginase [Pedobacter sp.]|nr:MAG: arginase [Pedobacter sp.]